MSGSALNTIPPAPLDEPELREDGVFEMANLTAAQTGIESVVYISAREGGHGPRVKYFVQPGRSRPSYSVSVDETPRLLASSLPDGVVSRTLPQVTRWVAENRAGLLDFWTLGDTWTDEQVTAFKAALKRV